MVEDMERAKPSGRMSGRDRAVLAVILAWASVSVIVMAAVNLRYDPSGIVPLPVAYASLAWVATSGLSAFTWMVLTRPR